MRAVYLSSSFLHVGFFFFLFFFFWSAFWFFCCILLQMICMLAIRQVKSLIFVNVDISATPE